MAEVRKIKNLYSKKDTATLKKKRKLQVKSMDLRTRKLADEIIRQNLAGETQNVRKAAEVSGVNYRTAILKTHMKTFIEYLDDNLVSDSTIAKILGDKIREHYALPAGEDKELPKYLDMAFKVKGLYNNKLSIDVTREPEAITMMKRIIDGEEVYDDGEVQDDS